MTRPFAGLILALLTVCPSLADDQKLPDTAAFDKLVVDSLREVHNKGADLYNTKKDFTGSFRMYEGALIAVKPLLAHRPNVQKQIVDGLAAAEKEQATAQKAFKLHETIEAVRASLKSAELTPAPEPREKKE